MKRGDKYLVFFLVIAVVAGLLLRFLPRGDRLIAEIRLNDEIVRTIDLKKVDEPYQFRIETNDDGYNIVRVEIGRIRVVEANCPAQTDVKQGWISRAGQSIVCLPHKLVIRLLGEVEDIDGIVR